MAIAYTSKVEFIVAFEDVEFYLFIYKIGDNWRRFLSLYVFDILVWKAAYQASRVSLAKLLN